MVKKWYIALAIILVMGIYFRSFMLALIVHSEPIDMRVINTMMKCRINSDKTVELYKSGSKHVIPLPDGTAYFRENAYLTSTTDLHHYLNETLPRYGWAKWDQVGALIIIKDDAGERTFYIYQVMFTRFYLKLKFRM